MSISLPHWRSLPSAGRLLAALLALAFAGGLLLVINGPWLRVDSVAWAGTRYTSDARLNAILDPLRGASLLAIDTTAVAEQLSSLPAVAAARVETRFPHGISVELTEKAPALVWRTSAVQLVVADDGAVIGEVPLPAALPAGLATLPFVDDRRAASRNIVLGARIPADELATALELRGIDPAALGSSARSLAVTLDDACGYSIQPRPRGTWTAVFGSYGLDVGDRVAVAARIGEQVAAVRTLFASHRENTVGWVDARNPGKVYWRANGPGGSDTC